MTLTSTLPRDSWNNPIILAWLIPSPIHTHRSNFTKLSIKILRTLANAFIQSFIKPFILARISPLHTIWRGLTVGSLPKVSTFTCAVPKSTFYNAFIRTRSTIWSSSTFYMCLTILSRIPCFTGTFTSSKQSWYFASILAVLTVYISAFGNSLAVFLQKPVLALTRAVPLKTNDISGVLTGFSTKSVLADGSDFTVFSCVIWLALALAFLAGLVVIKSVWVRPARKAVICYFTSLISTLTIHSWEWELTFASTISAVAHNFTAIITSQSFRVTRNLCYWQLTGRTIESHWTITTTICGVTSNNSFVLTGYLICCTFQCCFAERAGISSSCTVALAASK